MYATVTLNSPEYTPPSWFAGMVNLAPTRIILDPDASNVPPVVKSVVKVFTVKAVVPVGPANERVVGRVTANF